MRPFEALLHIPADHRLVLVRSRARGGSAGGVYWEHEEFDGQGRLAARYESRDEMLAEGARRSDWRKFDTGGRLVAQGSMAVDRGTTPGTDREPLVEPCLSMQSTSLPGRQPT